MSTRNLVIEALAEDLYNTEIGKLSCPWEYLADWKKEAWRCEVDPTRDKAKVVELCKANALDRASQHRSLAKKLKNYQDPKDYDIAREHAQIHRDWAKKFYDYAKGRRKSYPVNDVYDCPWPWRMIKDYHWNNNA